MAITTYGFQAKVLAGVWGIVSILSSPGWASAPRIVGSRVNIGWLEMTQEERGWRVEKVVALGTWKVPLLTGDLLVEIQEHDAATVGPISVAALLQSAELHNVNVRVERNGVASEVGLLAAREDVEKKNAKLLLRYGIGVVLRGAEGSSGVEVSGTVPGSPSERIGLRVGDRIIEVDGKDVINSSVSQVVNLLTSDVRSNAQLHIRRGTNDLHFVIDRIPVGQLYPKAQGGFNFPIQDAKTRAPTFRLLSTRGTEESLSERRGHWVLINFWGVWCSPCHLELPFLQRLSKEFSGRLTILGLDVGDTSEALTRFLKQQPINYDVLLAGDLESEVPRAFNLQALPATFLVDPEGFVRYVELGFSGDSSLVAILSKYLGAEP